MCELLDQLAEQLHNRQPVTPLSDQAEQLLVQLDEPGVAATQDSAVVRYQPIQSQLRLIAHQLAPLSDAASRLTSTSKPAD